MNDCFHRSLSAADIRAIAAYLRGTDAKLSIALSEMGYNPRHYRKAEIRKWLREEAEMVRSPETGVWQFC